VLQQTQLKRAFGDRCGEVVPSGCASIAPMEDRWKVLMLSKLEDAPTGSCQP
jgi:hypothetical protein